MIPYADNSGASGITAYEPGPDSIIIEFRNGATYLYTSASSGSRVIAEMKRLAAEGRGLNTYLNEHTHDRYAKRIR